MATNDAELYGWAMAIGLAFVLPVIVFLYLEYTDPNMECKRSLACYLGWMPSNVISIWYLHYSIGFINAFMILIVCEIVQYMFIKVMANIFVSMFGEQAFK